MTWKTEYAERRRAKYQADASERERRKSQGRTPEENAVYMREYYQANPAKFKRTPEAQAKVNAARRARYASDEAYRLECIASAKKVCKVKRRAGRLSKTYGVSLDDFEAMLEAQNGGCAICAKPHQEVKGERLHVDHCHATGQVRGLLCSPCNHGIGNFKDNVERLKKAAKYLSHKDK